MKIRTVVVGIAVPVALGFGLGMATAPRAELGAGGLIEGETTTKVSKKISALSTGKPSSAVMLSRVANHPKASGFNQLMAYVKLIQTAEVDEFPELMERVGAELGSAGELMHGDFLTALLVERWVIEDSLGALEAVLSENPPAMRDEFWSVVEAVAKEHPREAWAAIRGMEYYGELARRQDVLMHHIANEHPGVALGLLAELKPGADLELIKKTLGIVAKQRPHEAMAFAESLPVGALGLSTTLVFSAGGLQQVSRQLASGETRTTMVVARAWAETDPKSAVAWAEALEGSWREVGLSETVATWGKVEPEAAMEYARENLGSIGQGKVFEQVMMSKKLPLDRRRAVAEAQGGVPTLSQGYYRFTEQWMREDATSMAAWMAERPGRKTETLLKSAATNWAHSSGARAAVEVVDIVDSTMRQIAIEEVAKQLQGRPEIKKAPEVQAAVDALEAGGDTP